MCKRRACGFYVSCFVLVSILGLASSRQSTTDPEGTEALKAQRNALLDQLRASTATAEQVQSLLQLAARAMQTGDQGNAPDLFFDTQEAPTSPGETGKLVVSANIRQLIGSNNSTTPENVYTDELNAKRLMIGVAVLILLYEMLHIFIHFEIIPRPGFRVKLYNKEQEVFHTAAEHIISTRTLAGGSIAEEDGIRSSQKSMKHIMKGKVEQAWCEQLGLCETEAGEGRWFGQSVVDPCEAHAQHAEVYEIDDECAWPGKSSAAASLDLDRSKEEQRIVNLQPSFLARERYVTVRFWSLLFRQIWSDEPGDYPGPAFETKEEFTKGCRPGSWPLALHTQPKGEEELITYGVLDDAPEEEDEWEEEEDVDISELTAIELVRELRSFIWRNNSAGSWKAAIIMVILGASTFPSTYLFSRIVEIISLGNSSREQHHTGVFTFYLTMKSTTPLSLLLLLIFIHLCFDLACSLLNYKFWTVVPKYGVMRQFQSFFGRQSLKILMTQAGSKSRTLKCAHENLFKSSPGLCQAMTNYCCQAVVLSLWGKYFDLIRAVATLVTSVILILYSFASLDSDGSTSSFSLQNVWRNILQYGGYLVLFISVNFSMVLMNILSRFKESVDMWGAATKTKLNKMSLQQELTVRMMRAGKNAKGGSLTAKDQQALDEACSEWHDACRIYGNRDFHTWFATWIITENSDSMIKGITLAMVMVVLGSDALCGQMDVGTFVLLVGAVRSINGALAHALDYYVSLPEGYVCLLHLAQVCNMA